ncbi:MAG: hypothetical protein AABY32_05130 [Nanoarchaeota archaeon]
MFDKEVTENIIKLLQSALLSNDFFPIRLAEAAKLVDDLLKVDEKTEEKDKIEKEDKKEVKKEKKKINEKDVVNILKERIWTAAFIYRDNPRKAKGMVELILNDIKEIIEGKDGEKG